MTDNIFKIGDTVWTCSLKEHKNRIPCPVCFTKKKVTLVLGDDTEVQLDCRWCQSGFDPPAGYIEDGYLLGKDVVQRIITGIDQRSKNDDTRITYWFSGQGFGAERVAETREEAMQKATSEAEKYTTNNRVGRENRKHKEYESYSWNAGYYMRQAKRGLKDYEHYLDKARVMESKARKQP